MGNSSQFFYDDLPWLWLVITRASFHIFGHVYQHIIFRKKEYNLGQNIPYSKLNIFFLPLGNLTHLWVLVFIILVLCCFCGDLFVSFSFLSFLFCFINLQCYILQSTKLNISFSSTFHYWINSTMNNHLR